MFNNIVVAVDGSEASARVLAVACDLAKNMAAKLTIVHSPQPETTTLAIGAVAGLHAAMAMPGKEEIEAAGQQVLDSALTQAKGFGMDEVNSVMRRGEAADEVVAGGQGARCRSDYLRASRSWRSDKFRSGVYLPTHRSSRYLFLSHGGLKGTHAGKELKDPQNEPA